MNNIVDVWFRAQGSTLPSLHGYLVYAAVSRQAEHLHEARWLGIHTMQGYRVEGQQIQLLQSPKLGLRIPAERISEVLCLTGKALDVGGHPLLLGVPEIVPLSPSPTVVARMVTIAGFLEPEGFEAAARRQLDDIQITAEMSLGRRLVQRIAGDMVVGFGLTLRGLSPENSLRVQAYGVGGRRRMGCGLFRSVTERKSS